MNDTINYYELLGIKNTATKEEIRQAYKTLIKKWHPDINKDANANNMSIMLNEAKTILLDDIKRKEYDEYLKNKVNKTYENIRNKANKNNNTYTNTNYNYNNNEKTYTKWEYYKDYMKYYNASIWFKLFVSLGILVETLFCSVLQILNLLIAFIFCFMVGITEYLINYIIGLIIIALVVNIISGNINEFSNWITIICIFIGIIFIFILPEIIISFLTEKMPIYLSKLNIFLFKKCVGYKD